MVAVGTGRQAVTLSGLIEMLPHGEIMGLLVFLTEAPKVYLSALTDEQKSRIQAMKPMTKEEWDARQSVIRRVVDPETGRMRCDHWGGGGKGP